MIKVGNFCLESVVEDPWLSYSWNQRPSANKCEHGLEHDLSPQSTVDNLCLILPTDYRSVRVPRCKEGASLGVVTSYSKSWCSPETVCDQNTSELDVHRCRCKKLGQQVGCRCAFLSMLSDQMMLRNSQWPQRALNALFQIIRRGSDGILL